MTSNSDAWIPADHPRDGASGRFSEKLNSAPETTLTGAAPTPVSAAAAARYSGTAVLVPIIDEVPYHLRAGLNGVPGYRRSREEDNPLLVAFRDQQEADGDAAQRWLDAIDAHFSNDPTQRGDHLRERVVEIVGTPRDEADVTDWMQRTEAWRTQAIETLVAEGATFKPGFEVDDNS